MTAERHGAGLVLGLVALGSVGIQVSAAVASTLFDGLGPFAVSAWRTAIAALLLGALVRPRLRGRGRDEWLGIAVFGVAMAAMNLCLYAAIERLPLGVAVTLDFLGPCGVALLTARRVREGLCALAALTGVVLISGPGGYFDAAGFAFGLGAGTFFGLYTFAAERVGKATRDLSGVALAVAIAALVSVPFGIGTATSISAPQWTILAVSAILGVAIPYTADTVAARRASARVIGTLFSIDPLVGALTGIVLLHQSVRPPAVLGIALVVAAGAVVVWLAARTPAEQPEPVPI